MQGETVLITGANGEIGHLLLPEVRKQNPAKIITLDLHELHEELSEYVDKKVKGSVSDRQAVRRIFTENQIDVVIHLAAKLSTSSERDPLSAFETNVEGTNYLLAQAADIKNKPLFFFPSSISAYGLPNLKTKSETKVTEDQYTNPITLYGIHKIYGEKLGRYYDLKGVVDFRCIRFPGLMSADTLPTGGTSDFGPEIIHYFAKHKNYSCYAREDSYLPFMAMPDAINSIIMLLGTDKEKLSQHVYNINAFSASPKEIIKIARENYENIDIKFEIDEMRQKILDSWPKGIDDNKARKDWNWKIKYNFESAFTDYLIPKIK